MKKTLWIPAGILSAFLWTGCGLQGEQIMIQTAQSGDYSQGYGDGCAWGRHAAGADTNGTKDTQRYLNNTQYKTGWDTGYRECKFREEHVRALPQERQQPLRF